MVSVLWSHTMPSVLLGAIVAVMTHLACNLLKDRLLDIEQLQ